MNDITYAGAWVSFSITTNKINKINNSPIDVTFV